MKDIFIIGAGCIGQTIGCSLLDASEENRVFLVELPEFAERVREMGMRVEGVLQRVYLPSERLIVTDMVDEKFLVRYGISDNPLIFLAVKSNDVDSSLRNIESLILKRDCTIICIQNGLGVEEKVKSLCPYTSVLKAQVFYAASRSGSTGAVVVQNEGKIYIKDEGNDVIRCHTDYRGGLVDFELLKEEDFNRRLCSKLTINCAFNALTVILGKQVGPILLEHRDLVRSIVEELQSVYDKEIPNCSTVDSLMSDIDAICCRFPEHYSSMYYDVYNGLKTEIGFLNGAIVDRACSLGLSLPLNDLIVRTIGIVEQKRNFYETYQELFDRCEELALLRKTLLEDHTAVTSVSTEKQTSKFTPF